MTGRGSPYGVRPRAASGPRPPRLQTGRKIELPEPPPSAYTPVDVLLATLNGDLERAATLLSGLTEHALADLLQALMVARGLASSEQAARAHRELQQQAGASDVIEA